jgi:hypothetical protein
MIRKNIEHEMQRWSDADLGAAVREFFVEANHGGWDGWQGRPMAELKGMLALVKDLTTWLTAHD